MVNAAIFQSNTGDPPVLTQARNTTMAALTSLDEQTILNLTQLTLPEIRKIQKEVARVLPAGNLPALILSGLLKLDGRYINRKQVQNDLNALLKGFSLLPKGLYGVFVMGPAAVLYGYQMLLQLSGKEPASAFPEGTWQFYLQFGLREDTARHANETLGFHQSLPAKPDSDKMATAWVLTALDLLYQYDRLLAADWRERVMLRLIQNVANEAQMPPQPMINTLVYDWNKERPYHRTHADANYLEEREQAFTNFVNQRLTALAPDMITQIQQLYAEREAEELPAYQNQMSILATLKPDNYQERKELIPLRRAAIGFIWNGQTYLIPACQRDKDGSPLCYPADNGAPIPIYTMKDGTLCDGHKNILTISRSGEVRYARNNQYVGNLKRPSAEAVLAWVSAILNTKKPDQAPELDLLLANAPRQQHEQLRKKLPEATQQEIDMWLSRAPILINWDAHPANQFLGDIRNDHRGIGDHALTLFRT
ncbi:MAG: hypothetical protein JW981_01980, partial [Anaerolineae bacterium]|nr:hypothetical protein [Anaerolineae bacterium]